MKLPDHSSAVNRCTIEFCPCWWNSGPQPTRPFVWACRQTVVASSSRRQIIFDVDICPAYGSIITFSLANSRNAIAPRSLHITRTLLFILRFLITTSSHIKRFTCPYAEDGVKWCRSIKRRVPKCSILPAHKIKPFALSMHGNAHKRSRRFLLFLCFIICRDCRTLVHN